MEGFLVYYESIKRELNKRLILECRCDERLKAKVEESTRLATNIFSLDEDVVYYESRKRELKRRLVNEGRCDERLKAKVEESTCLAYTGLHDKTN